MRLPRDEGHAPQVEKEPEWLPKLRPHLSLPVTVPLAKGMPDEGYPFYWSVNRWIEGETVRHDNISDINELAVDLSRFIKELHQIDASNGPAGGEHNYFRGCPLTVWKFHGMSFGIIVAIEIIQYVTNLGATDIDDVILNMTGCLIGNVVCVISLAFHSALSYRGR